MIGTDVNVKPMFLTRPYGISNSFSPDFVLKAISAIKNFHFVSDNYPCYCYVVGFVNISKSKQKSLILALRGTLNNRHYLGLFIANGDSKIVKYAEYQCDKNFSNGVDLNDFELYDIAFGNDMTTVLVLETKKLYKLYIITPQDGLAKFEDLILTGTSSNLFSLQIEILSTVLKEILENESCCFVLKTKKGVLVVTSREVYDAVPSKPLEKTDAKYHGTTFKTFIETYTRYRKDYDKGTGASEMLFLKKNIPTTDDFTDFVPSCSLPFIEPKFSDKLSTSKTQKPIIHTFVLNKTYYYVFILQTIVWVCDDRNVVHYLDCKGIPYRAVFNDSNLIYLISEKKITVLDFEPGHRTCLIESMKSLHSDVLFSLHPYDTNTFIDPKTFYLYQIDYNSHFFIDHLYSPSQNRATFLHLLFRHNVTISTLADTATIQSFLPISFETVSADYLIDFFTHAIPAEIRRICPKGLTPKEIDTYIHVLFSYPISFDIRSIKPTTNTVSARLPLFGRAPPDRSERIRYPMDVDTWRKQFKKCLNLIFLHSYPSEGQNLIGQECFVKYYYHILNNCITTCYNNFEKHICKKYPDSDNISNNNEGTHQAFEQIIEKINFHSCIQEVMHQLALQAEPLEVVDNLVVEAYKILPFRIFSQYVINGCLRITPNAYNKISESIPPSRANDDLLKIFGWTTWREIPRNTIKPLILDIKKVVNIDYVEYMKSTKTKHPLDVESDPQTLFLRSVIGYSLKTNHSTERDKEKKQVPPQVMSYLLQRP
ncbi:Uncharacterized protein QTN25_000290 [Entamoeba marina]